jgi:hypothetical protein
MASTPPPGTRYSPVVGNFAGGSRGRKLVRNELAGIPKGPWTALLGRLQKGRTIGLNCRQARCERGRNSEFGGEARMAPQGDWESASHGNALDFSRKEYRERVSGSARIERCSARVLRTIGFFQGGTARRVLSRPARGSPGASEGYTLSCPPHCFSKIHNTSTDYLLTRTFPVLVCVHVAFTFQFR